jgi:phosphatidate cytidylyltransferase
MKRVLTALVLMLLVFLVVFKAPPWGFTLVVGMFGTLAAFEYLRLVRVPLHFVAVALLLVALGFASEAMFQYQDLGAAALSVATVWSYLVALTPFILLSVALGSEDFAAGMRAAALSTFTFAYAVMPMRSLIGIRAMVGGVGWFFLILFFAVVWSGDIFAYYVGKKFGKHKLAPRISPGKTWEGAIASVVGAAMVGVALAHFAGPIQQWITDRVILERIYQGQTEIVSPPMWITILAAVLINIAAQLGDLAESMIKRGAGAKDSGTLFPGHGGVLDRIDALLFAAPLAAIIFPIIQPYFIRVHLPK